MDYIVYEKRESKVKKKKSKKKSKRKKKKGKKMELRRPNVDVCTFEFIKGDGLEWGRQGMSTKIDPGELIGLSGSNRNWERGKRNLIDLFSIQTVN